MFRSCLEMYNCRLAKFTSAMIATIDNQIACSFFTNRLIEELWAMKVVENLVLFKFSTHYFDDINYYNKIQMRLIHFIFMSLIIQVLKRFPMDSNHAMELYYGMKLTWNKYFSMDLYYQCNLDDNEHRVFALMARKLAKQFLDLIDKNEFDFERKRIDEFAPNKLQENAIYDLWRETYTWEVHEEFLKVIEQPKALVMYVVASSVAIEQMDTSLRMAKVALRR